MKTGDQQLRSLPELVVIGAMDADGVVREAQRIANYIEKTPSASLHDIAYTCGVNARSPDVLTRGAIVATSLQDLAAKLPVLVRRTLSGGPNPILAQGVFVGTGMCPAPGRTVFLFPGEGSQYPDMLRELALHFPAARSAFDDADTACAMAGAKVLPSHWIYPTGDARLQDQQMDMATTLQAVVAADTALMRLFATVGVTPDAVVGAGIGELMALECAGAFDFKSREERLSALADGYRLILKFDEPSATAPGTKCFSVTGVAPEKLGATLAQFQGKAIVTQDLSGDISTVCVLAEYADALSAALADCGAMSRKLPISKPFHTEWFHPFAEDLRVFFSRLVTKEPDIPVYSCLSAAQMEGDKDEMAALAVKQWEHPVHLRETIERLYADGYRVFVEMGPRGAFTSCVSATLRRRPHLALAANRSHRPDLIQFYNTLAALAAHGTEINVEKLHWSDDPHLLDFGHPGQTHAQRIAKTITLPTDLPLFGAASLPETLVCNSRAFDGGDARTSDGRRDDKTRAASFPLMANADISKFTPGRQIEFSVAVSTFDFPMIADAAFAGGPISTTDKSLRGLTFVPAVFLLELMAEAAGKIFPELQIVAAENFGTTLDREIGNSPIPCRVSANVRPRSSAEPERVDVAVLFGGRKVASATIALDDDFPEQPADALPPIQTPVFLNWRDSEIYGDRLADGPAFRTMRLVREYSSAALAGDCIVPPRNGLVRQFAEPEFSIDPVLLSTIGRAVAAWNAREPASGRLFVSTSCEKIVFFARPQPAWTQCEFSVRIGRDASSADAADISVGRQTLLRAKNWKCAAIDVGAPLHALVLNPSEGVFSREIPRSLMPVLSHEVICCDAAVPDDMDEFKLQLAASLTLSAAERMTWSSLGASVLRRTEWLFGRIAAKDAVRRCLLARYGRKWAAADIRIEPDEAGKPTPQGVWRNTCGALMDISISHTTGHIVAAAAPNASLGIDIELTGRTISEEFVAAAFSHNEQELAADSGVGATALFRFWCAKEALSKALGTGLRYGARDLCAKTFDPETGKVGMEASQLWLRPFPHLKGVTIDVQSCIIGDLLLAVCALDSETAESATGPYMHFT